MIATQCYECKHWFPHRLISWTPYIEPGKPDGLGGYLVCPICLPKVRTEGRQARSAAGGYTQYGEGFVEMAEQYLKDTYQL